MSFEEIAIVIALVGVVVISFCAVSMARTLKRVTAIAGPQGERGHVGVIGQAGEPGKLPERLIFYRCASCNFGLGVNGKWGQQRDTPPTCCGMVMSRDYEIHNDIGERTTWTGPK